MDLVPQNARFSVYTEEENIKTNKHCFLIY